MADRIADAKQKLATLLDKVPQTHAHGAGNDPVRVMQADAESALYRATEAAKSDNPDVKRIAEINVGRAEAEIARLESLVNS